MSLSKKRPTFLRFIFSILAGALISAGILIGVQQFYQSVTDRSALIEPFFLLAAVTAVLIALFLFFPVNKPGAVIKGFMRLLVLVALVALLWVMGGFWIAQDELLYLPGRTDTIAETALAENTAVEKVILSGPEGVSYQGYFWKNASEKAGLILYFGGNDGLASERVDSLIKQGAGAMISGFNFLVFDYPGYGRSAGIPGEDSIYTMAKAAWDYALTRDDADPARIVIAGWSLGTGTAARLADDKKPAGLILLAPYYNGTELVSASLVRLLGSQDAQKALMRWPLNLLVRQKYTSESYARGTKSAALIIGGKADQMIPWDQAERLAKEYENGQFLLLEGDHGAMWTEQASLDAIGAFLKTVGQPKEEIESFQVQP